MKKYNRALDSLMLAIVAARRGNLQQAATLFQAAVQSPDAVRAVQVIEASNQHAFEQLKAAAKASVKAAAKPAAAKPAVKVAAGKRIKASEDDGDFADGAPADDTAEDFDDEFDVVDGDEEVSAGDDEAAEDEDESEEAEDEEGEGEEGDDDFTKQFASVLASMQKQRGKPAKK